jgi:hypothetical protein
MWYEEFYISNSRYLVKIQSDNSGKYIWFIRDNNSKIEVIKSKDSVQYWLQKYSEPVVITQHTLYV